MKKLRLILCKVLICVSAFLLIVGGFTAWADRGEDLLIISSGWEAEVLESSSGWEEEMLASSSDWEEQLLATPSDLKEGRAVEKISLYNIVELKGEDGYGGGIEESFSEEAQIADRTWFKAKQAYSRSGLQIKIRRRGWTGSIGNITPNCKVMGNGDRSDIIIGPSNDLLAWAEWHDITNISPDVSELHLQFIAYTTWGNGDTRRLIREITIPLLDERTEAPTSPEIVYDPSHPDVYMLTGVDSSMEYSCVKNPYTRAAGYEWIPCEGTDVELTPTTNAMICMVRYKATDTQPESQYVELKIPALKSAPSITFDKKKEVLSGLTTEMEYRLGEEAYKPVTEAFLSGDASEMLDGITESADLKIRYKANGAPPGQDKTITLYERREAPTGLVLDPVTFRLQGTASGMEYLLDTATSWKSITQSYVDLKNYALSDREVIVQVRYRYTTTNSNSRIVTLTIPRLTDAPENLLVDYSEEVVRGFDAGKSYQYATSLTGTWYSIKLTNGAYDISSKIKTSGDVTLYIRRAATADSPFSAATAVFLPKRRAALTDIAFSYNDAVLADTQARLNNLPPSAEYQLSGTKTWEPCSEGSMIFDLPTASKTYRFRLRATGDAFASAEKSLTLYAPAAAPSCSLNITKEEISSVKNTMEYQINGGVYTPAGDVTAMPMADIADSLKAGETYVIRFRYARTATRPASKIKEIVIYPRPDIPTGLSYNTATFTLSGVSSKMQYREVGTATWKSISSSTVKLSSLVGDRTDVKIEVRYKPASGVFASQAVIVNLFN